VKRTIPLLIAGAAGLIMLVSFFVPPWESWGEDAGTWFNILQGFAFILGGGNLLKVHLKKVSDRRRGWGYSGVTLIAFVVALVCGLLKIGVAPLAKFPEHAWSGPYNQEGSAFWYFFEYAFKPLVATTFSLLAFFVASAAFRAFRAKNLEASLLLGTAFLILLGRTFAGTWLTSWMPPSWEEFTIPGLGVTVMQVFVTAGNRAIMIGIALGVASTSLKVILGLDRSYLGAEGK